MHSENVENPVDAGESDERTSLPNDDVAVEVQRPSSGSSWYASVFMVVNAALGAGLLNFPAAYDRSGGILVAVAVQTICLVFIIGSMIILAYCSDINKAVTYQGVVSSLCGSKMETLCTIGIIIYIFGASVVYFIVIGDQLDIFFTYVYGPSFCHKWYMNRKFTTAITSFILILPLCFSKRIDFLKYASACGVTAMLYCALLVLVKYFTSEHHPATIKTRPSNIFDLFNVIPVICFSYQCHLSLVPVYSCFEKRNLREITKTIFAAIGLCAVTYTLTASVGYLTFGSTVNEDILLSYKPTVDVLIAVVLIAAKMYTVYPISVFVGRAAIETIVVTKILSADDERISSGEVSRRFTISIIWFSSSLVLAIFLPNIGVVISALGGLASIFVFVIPGLCLLRALNKNHTNLQNSPMKHHFVLITAISYMVLGSFIFGETTTRTIWNDIEYGTNEAGSSHKCTDI